MEGGDLQCCLVGQNLELAPRVVWDVNAHVKELVNRLKMDYKKTTNYHHMWRAHDLVRDWYPGG